ncbi:MAG: ABC transporter substrate-binding protein [Thermodesulfobacteriota bacterium]
MRKRFFQYRRLGLLFAGIFFFAGFLSGPLLYAGGQKGQDPAAESSIRDQAAESSIRDQAAESSIRDQAGRRVSVPADPKRVVALAPSITEVVFALDRGDRLVGVTQFSDYPKAAESIDSVGSYVYLDLEKIVSLNPDLCLAIKDGNPRAIVARLGEIGIPVYAVNPRGLDSVMETIADIGKLVNAGEKAEAMIADMRDRLETIDQRVATASHRPRVFFQIGVNPIVSAGADTFIHELIVRAGGKNMAGDVSGYPRFSKEEVIAQAPDIIIVTSMARKKTFEEVIAKWQQWSDIPAVKNGRIYLVDSDVFDRPSPRLIEALEKLVRLIHPELFGGDGGEGLRD